MDTQLPPAVWVRCPNVFPLPLSATTMFRWISRRSSRRPGLSGLVVLPVAVWRDSEWIYMSVFIRDQIAICLELRSLYKPPDRYMQTVWICVEVTPAWEPLTCMLFKMSHAGHSFPKRGKSNCKSFRRSFLSRLTHEWSPAYSICAARIQYTRVIRTEGAQSHIYFGIEYLHIAKCLIHKCNSAQTEW